MDKQTNIEKFYIESDDALFKKRNLYRDLIPEDQWQNDGAYKEALLKEILTDKLYGTGYHVGSGYIINQNKQTYCNKQIDILIFKKNPTHLFRHQDLYIIDVNSVRAVIEVKSKLHDNIQFENILRETSKIGKFISENRSFYNADYFVGVFSYEGYEKEKTDKKNLKEKLTTTFNKQNIRKSLIENGVNFINLNRDILIERIGVELRVYELEQQSYSYYIETLCDWLIDEKLLPRISVSDKPHTASPLKDKKPKFKITLSNHVKVD